jgi:hypothetical protein
MKTEIFAREASPKKLEYPCVMEYSFRDSSQELVVLFTSWDNGIVLHAKNNGWRVGESAKHQNPEYSGWRPFIGSIKFS